MSHITTLNGKHYCLYCMNELAQDETCTCKGYKNAVAKAQKKEEKSKGGKLFFPYIKLIHCSLTWFSFCSLQLPKYKHTPSVFEHF